MRRLASQRWSVLVGLLVLLAGMIPAARAQTDQIVYDDALQNGWVDWSWANVNYSNASPKYAGSYSAAVTVGGWEAIYLHHDAFNTTPYASLRFRIHGGATGGQKLWVQAQLGGSAQAGVHLAPLAANTWTLVTIPLSQLGAANAQNMDGFWIQDTSGGAQPTFYVDDIRLVASTEPPPPTQPVSVNVVYTAGRKHISPLIYGLNHASDSLSVLNSPIHRIGGNNMTRYNWKQNADNRGSDWFFQSIADDDPTPGGRINAFVRANQAAGAQSMVTIPIMGWVARVNADRNKLWSFSVAKYGPQQQTDTWNPDSGNGIRPDGSLVTGNQPRDANLSVTAAYQQEWLNNLVSTHGTAANGGIRYYVLDNEPSIWHETHRDVKPVGAKMLEVFTRMRDHAAVVKTADPTALVVGPEEWGWSGYFYSGYDLQWAPANGYQMHRAPDRSSRGGVDYMPWILDQFRRDQATRGKRLLDVFTLHYYPQGGEYSNDVSTSMQLRRNRSTRSLWDPNYTDETWINDKVRLVPRMKEWVAQYYPGTKIGLTEYNWGAENHINGATAQADVLGILGREGMDIATRWTTPPVGSPVYNAIRMYRNYDGAGSTFGDISVACTVPNPDNLAAFAAQDSKTSALTVMVINKILSGTTPVNVSIGTFGSAGRARMYQLTPANVINQLPDKTFTGNSFSITVPAQSITLLVIPRR